MVAGEYSLPKHKTPHNPQTFRNIGYKKCFPIAFF